MGNTPQPTVPWLYLCNPYVLQATLILCPLCNTSYVTYSFTYPLLENKGGNIPEAQYKPLWWHVHFFAGLRS